MAKNLETDLDLHGVARIFNLPTPIDDHEPATKLYVDVYGAATVISIVNGAARLIKTQRIMAGIVLRGQIK